MLTEACNPSPKSAISAEVKVLSKETKTIVTTNIQGTDPCEITGVMAKTSASWNQNQHLSINSRPVVVGKVSNEIAVAAKRHCEDPSSWRIGVLRQGLTKTTPIMMDPMRHAIKSQKNQKLNNNS